MHVRQSSCTFLRLKTFFADPASRYVLTELRDMWVTFSISRRLLLVPGLPCWLQISSETRVIFRCVRTDPGRPLPAFCSTEPVLPIFCKISFTEPSPTCKKRYHKNKKTLKRVLMNVVCKIILDQLKKLLIKQYCTWQYGQRSTETLIPQFNHCENTRNIEKTEILARIDNSLFLCTFSQEIIFK